MKITLDDIKNFLGQQGKQQHNEIVFACPICNALGRDKHGDNLKYNVSKNVLYCFSDDSHSKQILSEITKKKIEENKSKVIEIPNYIKYKEAYLFYQVLCNNALLGTLNKDWLNMMNEKNMFEPKEYDFYLDLIKSDKPQKAREYLKKKRGINTQAIELTGLGFDFKKRKWVIPIYDLSATLLGFRYRGANFEEKRVWTETNTPKTLALFYGSTNSKTVYIAEGEFDAIILTQWLLEKKQDDFMVVSPSNGADSLLSVITQLQFSKYKQIKLILDNDPPGDEATEKIINTYLFIKDCRDFLKKTKKKDINKYYLSVL